MFKFLNTFFSGVWDPYILPFQMPRITPVDKKVCMTQYLQCLRTLKESVSRENSVCSSPEPCASVSTPLYEPDMTDMDEDSKMSAITVSSLCSNEDIMSKRSGCVKSNVLQPISSGKNPRKSPRQHASTLAILSSLLYQRKRRSMNKTEDEPIPSLPVIPEESQLPNMETIEEEKNDKDFEKLEQLEENLEHDQEKIDEVLPQKTEEVAEQPKLKTASPKKYHWRFRPRVSYQVVSHNIENELNSAFEGFEKYSLESQSDSIDFHNCRVNTSDILRLYEEGKAKETDKSCRRFFNGTPGRKPGRKRKSNLTGWPNKNKRVPKREINKEKQEMIEKTTVLDCIQEDSDVEDAPKEVKKESECLKNSNENDCCDIDRVNKDKKTIIKKVKNEVLQPYVYVQKLDNKLIDNQIFASKRCEKKIKRVPPSSPKSPRKLRKPRGRWYKER